MTVQQMIQTLRSKYERINSIDPDGQAYAELINFLDKQPQKTLQLLSAAKIKWISSLARNRVIE